MTFIYSLPIWLLFAALAIPLACIAMASRQMSTDIAAAADYTPKTTDEGPVTYNDDGTRSQTFTVVALTSVSGQVTYPFGPVSISANAREWAANAVLLGLLLVLVGLVGLFHFPTATRATLPDAPIDYIGPDTQQDE
ncbi:hypothetical protein [Neorhodopirellula lusitana]|uniref:hypothetical protein n=1 Tax=Neorhodopirellula lusitana TaxID=445327 RepID=UPI00384F4EF4